MTSMNRFFIVSVGTSLIGQYNRSSNKVKVLKEMTPERFRGDLEPHEQFPGHVQAVSEKKYRAELGHYCKCWDAWQTYVKNFRSRDDIAKLSAEMSSLLLWRDELNRYLTFSPNDCLLLVRTSTPEGEFCAHALDHLITEHCRATDIGTPAVSIAHQIDGLCDAKDDEFAACGLPNFIKFIHQRIRESKKSFEVILVPTGGYKALIPYMVIAGILEQVPNWYVYEDSTRVLKLPPLPLHVDVPAWLQIQSVLDVLKGKDDYHEKRIYKAFQDSVSGLVATPADTGPLKLTGLDTVFRERVRVVADKPELVLRAKHSPLLAFLEDKDLEEKFLKLAEIGHLIWKGDRVPEMADHGLRHHNDLFHLAERVLLPVFYYDEDFLEPHELYTLLCALLLHDCGHVVGTVDLPAGGSTHAKDASARSAAGGRSTSRRLLPTEVRDYHHILGYLRLREWNRHGGTGRAIYRALKRPGETDEALWEQYLKAPATVGLYHRKKMCLGGSELYNFFDAKGDFVCSLEEHLKSLNGFLTVKGRPVDFDRAALLVCLLRIIDGLDEQASRTGGPNDVAFHLAQLETEANEREENARALGAALGSLPDMGGIFTRIDNGLARRIKHYIDSEGGGFPDPEIENRSAGEKPLEPEQFRALMDDILKDRPQWRPLFDEYIHSELLAFFKKFQREPYGEKVYIKEVTIGHEHDSISKITTLDIDLRVLSEEEASLIEAYIDAGCPGEIRRKDLVMNMREKEGRELYRKHMLGKLREEYTAEGGTVARILRQNHLLIHYACSQSGEH